MPRSGGVFHGVDNGNSRTGEGVSGEPGNYHSRFCSSYILRADRPLVNKVFGSRSFVSSVLHLHILLFIFYSQKPPRFLSLESEEVLVSDHIP